MPPLEDLRSALEAAAADLRGDRPAPSNQPTLERPPRADFGDYSTNAAMLLAPVLGESPRDVAQRLGEAVAGRLGDQVAKVDVAGPGFLNLFLADPWYGDALGGLLAAGDAFGSRGVAQPEKVNIEFVSSNPTGPIHIGHARGAAYGDALARMLEFHGHAVHREFYINDAGTQVRKFGESIVARARGEEPPADGYQGDYIVGLAREIEGAAEADPDTVGLRGVELMIERARRTLERFRVPDFHTWFSERSLHDGSPTPVDHAFEELEKLGASYRSEDALWLRTTQFGDDKDRVLVRKTGEHTYFASDIAYHQLKRERGFDRLIDVWGADHHGYVRRMHAAYAALGGDPDRLELLLMQLVHLVEGGSRLQMSKRAGDFVTLDDLVEMVGVDAARWFLLNRSHDTEINLDVELARRQSSDNPVYYVQYAHARISSILERAETEPSPQLAGALEPAERDLIKKLLTFPAEVAEAADRRAPHRIATYALETARTFTAFYERCQVIGADSEAFRLAACVASRRVLARSLDLLGVQAPTSM